MSQPGVWETIYVLTREGEEELRTRSTALSATELELLVRLDGRLDLAQIRAGMKMTEPEFLAALRGPLRRGLLRETERDPFMMDFAPSTIGLDALGDTPEVHTSFKSLKRKGYYVRIARRGASAPESIAGAPVVVVEDEPTVRTFLETLLKLQGYAVRSAGARKEVLQELNKRPIPALVLLDVQLPDVNGFDILGSLKNHPVLRQVPVIMLTGADTREAVIRGLAGGAEGYLTKPVDPESLLRAVRAVLGLEDGPEDSGWTLQDKQ